MSIAISCNLSDGVIMGADSAVTVSGRIESPDGRSKEGVLKVYNEAEKIFQLYDLPLHKLPVGVMTYGVGMLGERTLESYIGEFEYEYNKYNKDRALSDLAINGIAEKLKEFFTEKYEAFFKVPLEQKFGQKYEEIPLKNKPLLGLVIGGYSPYEYLSEVWQIQIPHDDKVREVRGKGNFGSNWFGMYQGIARLIKGFEPALLEQVVEYFVRKHNVPFNETINEDIKKIVSIHEYRIPYQAMPLQEGVDHVKFLLDVVINQHKFVVGASVCGGNIRMAVISRQQGFQRITENELRIST